MCDGGFDSLENMKMLAAQCSQRFEQEKRFLEEWVLRAEQQGDHRAALIFSQTAFELGRAVSTLGELKEVSSAHPEATVARV
ncbi:MAG TPA: hypothetical protein DD435_06935 [Cyanobacteria bacterium UBA8530]|nr:hypothetical protein [Cyanobacteria bacterium UBA8530]